MCTQILNLDNSEIQTVIMTIGVIVSGILTFLLWRTTKKLGKQQTEIQEKIANNNIDFQRIQDKNNYKLTLYQSRLNCYLNVVDVLSTDSNQFGLVSHGISENKISRSDLIKKSVENKILLFKSYKQSILLFDEKISQEFKIISEEYSKRHSIFEQIMMFSDLDISQEISDYIIKNKLQEQPLMEVYLNFWKDEENVLYMFVKFPGLKDYSEANKRIDEFNRNSKLEEMILPYLDLKDLY